MHGRQVFFHSVDFVPLHVTGCLNEIRLHTMAFYHNCMTGLVSCSHIHPISVLHTDNTPIYMCKVKCDSVNMVGN